MKMKVNLLSILGSVVLALAGCSAPGSLCPEGWRALEVRDYASAVREFSLVIGDAGGSSRLVRHPGHATTGFLAEQAELFAGRGRALHQMGYPRKALLDHDKAVKLQPDNAQWRLGRGLTRAALGDLSGALADFNEAIRIDPRNAKAFYNRGIVYQRTLKSLKAIADYTTAVRLDPKHGKAYNNRGLLLLRLGRTDAAIRDFDAAIGYEPLLADAYNNRASAYYGQGRSLMAFHDLNTAIKIDSRHVSAHTNRGLLYLDMENPSKAAADFEAVLNRRPHSARAWLNLANAHYKSGFRQRAQAEYQRAIKIDPAIQEEFLGYKKPKPATPSKPKSAIPSK